MSDGKPLTENVLGQNGNTRRNVLKTLGAVGLGGAALTGSASAGHGNTGGNMLSLGEPTLDELFSVDAVFDQIDIPASCHASESQLKQYQDTDIEYDNGDVQIAAIRENKLKHFDLTGGTEYVFNSKQACKDESGVWRASFSPA